MSSLETRPRVPLRRMPVAGTSALVGLVTLVALTLVVLTAVESSPARSATPPPAGSGGSRPAIGLLRPQSVAPTTTTPPPVTTTAAPHTVAPAVAPPTTHPPAPHPATPHPTTPPVTPLASHPILPPNHPAANIDETPNFASTCRTSGNQSPPCLSDATLATTAARAHEGLGAMVLPSNYAALTPGQQLFVLTNIERVDRGLPPVVGMVSQLNTDAQNAAAANTDPTPVSAPPGSTVMAWASNWAEGAGPLGSNYNWMYDDGAGSGNIACTATTPSSCWAHRDNTLGFNASQVAASHGVLAMGAAEATPASDAPWSSDAMLIVLMTGSPAYTYTWAQAQAAGAR